MSIQIKKQTTIPTHQTSQIDTVAEKAGFVSRETPTVKFRRKRRNQELRGAISMNLPLIIYEDFIKFAGYLTSWEALIKLMNITNVSEIGDPPEKMKNIFFDVQHYDNRRNQELNIKRQNFHCMLPVSEHNRFTHLCDNLNLPSYWSSIPIMITYFLQNNNLTTIQDEKLQKTFKLFETFSWLQK